MTMIKLDAKVARVPRLIQHDDDDVDDEDDDDDDEGEVGGEGIMLSILCRLQAPRKTMIRTLQCWSTPDSKYPILNKQPRSMPSSISDTTKVPRSMPSSISDLKIIRD